MPKHFNLAFKAFFVLYLLPVLFSHPLTSNPSPKLSRIPNIGCVQQGFYTCSADCTCDISEDYYNAIVIGISACGMIAALFFTGCFFSLKELRQKPGEIVLISSIFNFIFASTYMLENFDLLTTSNSSNINDTFCQILGVTGMLSLNLIFFYQLAFYLYKVLTLKNPLSGSKITRKRYHSLTLLLALILTASEYALGHIGRTMLGTCSLKTPSDFLFPLVINGVFLLVSCILVLFFKRGIKKRVQDLNTKQTKYVEHHFGYLVVLCILLIGIGFIKVDIATKVKSALLNLDIETQVSSLNILEICSFILTNMIPLLLAIGRIRDPAVYKPFKKKLKSLCCCYWQSQTESISEVFRLSESTPIDITENPTEESRRNLINNDNFPSINIKPILHKEKKVEDSRSVEQQQITKNEDPQMFYSVFSGIHYFWHLKKTQEQNGPKRVEKSDPEYYEKESKVIKKFTMHDSLLRQTVPQVYREIKNKNYKIKFGIFTAYAPNLFQDLIELDGIGQELQISIEIIKNFSNIISASTENNKFQFMTYNSKFILRRISKGDRRILMRILPRYIQHLKNKPYSLLSRIYGLFRFEVMNPYQQVNWILMKNISERSGHGIERMYEIKGVGLETRSIASQRALLMNLGSLGDEYFEKHEQAIHIDNHVREPLLEALKRDVDFLISEGLFNYSLNVSLVSRFKVRPFEQRLSSSVILEVDESLEDLSLVRGPSALEEKRVLEGMDEDKGRKTSLDRKETNPKKREQSLVGQVNIQNPFFSIKSTKENLNYSFEIDNYLSAYDWRKKIKALIHKCSGSNTCIQPPPIYATRLLEYVHQILDNKEDTFDHINYDDSQSYHN